MKFSNKFEQNIIEVLHYDEGPKVYGFMEKDDFFLACFHKESDEGVSFKIFNLDKDDKNNYKLLKEHKLSLWDFLKSKNYTLVDYDLNGKVVGKKFVKTLVKDDLLVCSYP